MMTQEQKHILDQAARKLGYSYGREYEAGEVIPAPECTEPAFVREASLGICGFCGASAPLVKYPGVLEMACPACLALEFPGESTMGAPAYADEQPEAIIRRRRDVRS